MLIDIFNFRKCCVIPFREAAALLKSIYHTFPFTGKPYSCLYISIYLYIYIYKLSEVNYI